MTVVTNGEIVSLAILALAGVWVVYKLLKYTHKAWSNNFIVGPNCGIMDINSWGKK